MRKSIGLLALVAGLALAAPSASALTVGKLSAVPSSDIVEVRKGGHGGMRHGGHGIRHGGIGHHHRHFGHRRHFGSRIFIAPVYGYGYGNSCHWLKRKAIRTGSRYWWRRYNDCRWG